MEIGHNFQNTCYYTVDLSLDIMNDSSLTIGAMVAGNGGVGTNVPLQ